MEKGRKTKKHRSPWQKVFMSASLGESVEKGVNKEATKKEGTSNEVKEKEDNGKEDKQEQEESPLAALVCAAIRKLYSDRLLLEEKGLIHFKPLLSTALQGMHSDAQSVALFYKSDKAQEVVTKYTRQDRRLLTLTYKSILDSLELPDARRNPILQGKDANAVREALTQRKWMDITGNVLNLLGLIAPFIKCDDVDVNVS